MAPNAPQTWDCPTCVTTGRRGYCAPHRCYCGHTECHAFTSWTPRAAPDDTEGW